MLQESLWEIWYFCFKILFERGDLKKNRVLHWAITTKKKIKSQIAAC